MQPKGVTNWLIRPTDGFVKQSDPDELSPQVGALWVYRLSLSVKDSEFLRGLTRVIRATQFWQIVELVQMLEQLCSMQGHTCESA